MVLSNEDQIQVLNSDTGNIRPGTVRGARFPEFTTVERDAISGPKDGVIIYNTTTGTLQKREGGVWTDLGSGGAVGFTLHFDANSALYPATDPAAALSRNAHPIIAFNDTTAENVVFSGTIPDSYGGEDVKVDIDWVAETAISGGVTWGVEFEANAEGGNDIDSDSFAAQQIGTNTTNATSGVITITTITLTQAEADAIAANDAFRLRVQRVTGDVGDTMTGDAQILKISVRA